MTTPPPAVLVSLRLGFRWLRAAGFFILIAAQVSACWVAYVRGRNDEQLELLRVAAPLLVSPICKPYLAPPPRRNQS